MPGVDEFLVKPVRAVDVANRVNAVIERRRPSSRRRAISGRIAVAVTIPATWVPGGAQPTRERLISEHEPSNTTSRGCESLASFAVQTGMVAALSGAG